MELIAGFQNGNKRCFMQLATIANQLRVSVRTVSRAKRDLIRLGVLSSVETRARLHSFFAVSSAP